MIQAIIMHEHVYTHKQPRLTADLHSTNNHELNQRPTTPTPQTTVAQKISPLSSFGWHHEVVWPSRLVHPFATSLANSNFFLGA